jgi:hypothetical protein
VSFAITRRTRAILVFVSAGAYVLSLCDVSERTEAHGFDVPGSATVVVDVSTPPSIASIVRRDPFAGEPGERTDPPSGVSDPGGPDPVVPDIVPGDAPPEGADAGAGARQPLALTVRATIVGRQAIAYVAEGGDLQLVRVGDTLASRRVAAIDERGIELSDGTRADLPESYLATPEPARPRRQPLEGAEREIQRLRTLLTNARAAVREPAATHQVPPAPSPLAPPAEVKPGPLPTVDARGLPVGVNPTPDASDPTAFPYPYPYPPWLH